MNDRRFKYLSLMRECFVKGALGNSFEFDKVKTGIEQKDREHFAIVAKHFGTKCVVDKFWSVKHLLGGKALKGECAKSEGGHEARRVGRRKESPEVCEACSR